MLPLPHYCAGIKTCGQSLVGCFLEVASGRYKLYFSGQESQNVSCLAEMLRVMCLQGLTPDSIDCGENNQGSLSLLGEEDADAPDLWVQAWLEKQNMVVLPSVNPENGFGGCLNGWALSKCDCTHLIAQLREEQDPSISGNGAITSTGQHCKAETSLPS